VAAGGVSASACQRPRERGGERERERERGRVREREREREREEASHLAGALAVNDGVLAAEAEHRDGGTGRGV
jgi:hypothetical protein